jgi:hypothetical protein
MLEQELARLEASRDDDLQWSNPEVAYEHEEFDLYREYQIIVRKRLAAPWIYADKRSGWSSRLDAAELSADQETADLLADLKSGYVRMKLMDEHLARLEGLEAVVTDARRVAAARLAEGEVSALEQRLMELSSLSIDASRREALRRRRTLEVEWRADMGIPPGDEVTLATVIDFVPVSLAPAAEYVSRVAERPAARSRVVLGRALAKEAEALKPTLLPYFDLYAGYKHVDPDDPGVVAGVSTRLPLFNWDGAASRRVEAQRRIVEAELEMHVARASTEVQALVALIRELEPTVMALRANLDEESTGVLLATWREGWITLDRFLNGIRIEVDGLDHYYNQLIMYYESLFRLEAITGATLFEPQGG